jgi:YhcH/YjgK/YiaL family protein
MIIDKLENAEFYFNLGELFEKGLSFLKKTDLKELTPGKYDIIPDKCYASVIEYDTKPESEIQFEAHKKYIDIQYIVEGCEKMGFNHIDDLSIVTPYNEEIDALFLEGKGDILTAKAGDFVIYLPYDAHKPGMAFNKPSHVKKVVVKVLV